MLQQIKFLKDYRCFKKGRVIDFKPLTLLVGDQGVGKSTLLHLLGDFKPKDKEPVIAVICSDRIETRSFDYEKDSPRMSSYVSTILDVATRFNSHGEFVRLMNETLRDQKGILWMMDEPDGALSIRSCLKLAESIKVALNNKCQIIAAVHSPILISQFPEVYSLEHSKWLKPEEFIATQTL